VNRGLAAALGVARNELFLQLRTKMLFAALFMPAIFVLAFGYLIGLQARPMQHLHVAVETGSAVCEAMAGTQAVDLTEYPGADAARAAVRSGDAVAAIVETGPGKMTLVVDDSQSAAARAAIGAITSGLLSGRTLPEGAAGPAGGAKLEIEELYGLGMDESGYLTRVISPGFVAMSLIYTAFVFAGFTLLNEKTRQTIYLLALAPCGRGWVLAGKMLASVVLMLLAAAVAAGVVVWGIGVAPAGSLAVLFLAVLLGGTGLLGFVYALSSVAKDETMLRVVVGVPLFLPMIFLSGITYPVAVFPPVLQSVARALPLTWVNDVCRAVFFHGAGFGDVAWQLGMLGGFCLVGAALGVAAISRLMRYSA